ncbi:MAG: TonB-dependent receptor [Candidatus Manganitrophaceae bacterium]
MRFNWGILLTVILIGGAAQAFAAEEGFSELEFFQEEAQSVTASRRLQPVREAPVAVEVITEEEIRASGATTLWDLMRFRVGMDVVDGRSGDGNRAIVSVRGFPEEYVKGLQVLVDGRNVYNAVTGGVYWEQLPVQIQDIERIEIVHGPNAALYGSNAALGVINILTKKPKIDGVFSLYGLGGNLKTYRGGAAFEKAGAETGFRLSYSYRAQDGFPIVPGNPFPLRDDLLSHKTNFRSFWRPRTGTELEFFAGLSWDEMGLNFDRKGEFRQGFAMFKLTQILSADSYLELIASRNNFNYGIKPDFKGEFVVDYYDQDVEAIHHIDWWNSRLRTAWGGSYRVSAAASEAAFGRDGFLKNPIRRGFIHQSFNLIEGVTLVGAASLEHSDTGGTEPAYLAAAVIAPSEDHTVRLSYSLAPTIPSLYETHANHQPLATLKLTGNPGLAPHRLQSYEIGYQGMFSGKRLLVETNLFQMRLRNLTTGYPESMTFTPSFLMTLSFDNLDSARARGAEAKFKYRFGPGRSVYTNYTIQHITDELGDKSVTNGTPDHKVNVGGLLDLGYFSVTLNAGYKSGYTLTSLSSGRTGRIPAYWRVDTRAAYRPTRQMELFVAGNNLLDSRHIEFPDGLEVPRLYYGGFILEF